MATARKRGSSLAMVLAFLTVAFLGVATLLGAALFQMSSVSGTIDSTRSRNRVDSVIALTIAQLLSSHGTFGASGESLQATLLDDPPGVVGKVTFASGLNPHSTNNLLNDASTRLWNGSGLAANTAYLLATSQNQSSTSWATEAFLQVPPYPYVVATSGRIVSQQGMLVGSMNPAQPPPTAPPAITTLLPGDIASNSTDMLAAISLSSSSTIDGDARAAGGIRAGPDTVKGGIYPDSGTISLPTLPIANYQPQPQQVLAQLPASLGGLTLEGYCSGTGSVHFSGDVTLDSAVVYVPGDLTIDGALHGTGAMFATGRTTIGGADGPSDLQTDNHVAIASGSDFTISGQGTQSSFFRGLIYTGGNLTASHICLLGACISNGGPNTAVTLNDVQALFVTPYAAVNFNVSLPLQPGVIPSTVTDLPVNTGQLLSATAAAVGQAFEISVIMQPYPPPLPAGAGPGLITLSAQQVGSGNTVSNILVQFSGPQAVAQALSSIQSMLPNPILRCSGNGLGEVPIPPAPTNWPGPVASTSDLTNFLDSGMTYSPPSAQALANAANPAIGAAGAGTQPYQFGVDEFVGFGDRLQVLLWRQAAPL